jgi:hypothetical protein
VGKAAGRERVRRRAHRISATTFDSKNGGHGAETAFAHPTDCLPKSISECTSQSDEVFGLPLEETTALFHLA